MQVTEGTYENRFVEESSDELKDECSEIFEESSTKLNEHISERSSSELRFRAKKDEALSVKSIGSSESSESKTLTGGRGPTSLSKTFGVSAVIVVFLASIGLWRALDLGSA